MDTQTAITERRSIKKFDPQHVMTDAEIKQLLSLAMLSPTSFNLQHWRFVLVQDPAAREALKAAAWGQAQVTESSLTVLITADTKAWEKDPIRYWKNAPEAAQQMLLPMINQFYTGREGLQRDEALRSVGMAAQTLMLAAKSMGYDTCPMIGFDADAAAKLVNLPQDHIIGMLVVVGKALEPARGRSGQLAFDDVVIVDKFA